MLGSENFIFQILQKNILVPEIVRSLPLHNSVHRLLIDSVAFVIESDLSLVAIILLLDHGLLDF